MSKTKRKRTPKAVLRLPDANEGCCNAGREDREGIGASGAKRATVTEIRVRGRAVSVPAIQIEGRTVVVTGKWLKIASLRDEDLI